MLSLGLNSRCVAPVSTSKSTQRAVCSHIGPTRQVGPHFRFQHIARPRPACRAEERSRDSLQTSDKDKLTVPDTPPSQQTSRSSEEASTSQPQQQTGEISQELRMLQERKRARSQEAAPTGYFAGILQEVKLIEWPKPKAAVLDTLLVIGIVFATSALLFGMNYSLAELSKLFYRR